jgi:hypothetical protein
MTTELREYVIMEGRFEARLAIDPDPAAWIERASQRIIQPLAL